MYLCYTTILKPKQEVIAIQTPCECGYRAPEEWMLGPELRSEGSCGLLCRIGIEQHPVLGQ
jgi:hypothetical protein